jgi:hypothetical protein
MDCPGLSSRPYLIFPSNSPMVRCSFQRKSTLATNVPCCQRCRAAGIAGGHGLFDGKSATQIQNGANQRSNRHPVDGRNMIIRQRCGMHMNDGAPLPTATPVTCHMHPIKRRGPDGQPVQHGGRGMTHDGAVMQLQCSRKDQLSMLLGASTFGGSVPHKSPGSPPPVPRPPCPRSRMRCPSMFGCPRRSG